MSVLLPLPCMQMSSISSTSPIKVKENQIGDVCMQAMLLLAVGKVFQRVFSLEAVSSWKYTRVVKLQERIKMTWNLSPAGQAIIFYSGELSI